MKRKLAVQLYSLRAEAEKNGMASVLKTVADIGYIAVEPAGFYDLSPKDFLKVATDLGLEMYSSHRPWCRIDNIDETIKTAHELGLNRVVCGYGPKDYENLDAIKRTADQTNTMLEKLAAEGLSLFQHNHYWEFEKIDGKLKYDIYAELCPKIKFQLDAYWSSNFGANDAAKMVEKFYHRIVLLHMKDGILEDPNTDLKMVNGTYEKKINLRPLGEGKLNIGEILAATPAEVDHIIVELDNSPLDMTESLRRSYQYMVKAGFGYGRK
ncbi:MAG: sugar phosphate isomerase/epimerase [Lentisphaerae bacterium]|jgi:sugar phosphate isomerase/epimerase|nr:sugar phosphate isomerase/epimerase [Lentisphaerota bacterium]